MSAITPAIRPAIGPAIRSVFEGGHGVSLAAQISALFRSGEQGAWYDLKDMPTIYQDAAATIPGALNQPVGRLLDKSGRGNHASQATTTARPTLTAVTGRNTIGSDFVDDVLPAPNSLVAPGDLVWGTPNGWMKSELSPSATFRLPLAQTSGVLVHQGLSAPQLAAVGRYLGGDKQYLVALSPDTLIQNLRCYTGGAVTTLTAVGANGVTTTISLSANADTSWDLGAAGLTAPCQIMWPDSLSANTSLSQFYCHANQLTGSIPSLSANTSLSQFYCHANQLTGSIPSLSANTSLSQFYCYANQLTGSIPSLSANPALTGFSCHTNQLTGSIPSLSANPALTGFYCHANQLTGSIPSLSANPALTLFYCYSNQLAGSIPSLAANTSLSQFYCHANQLTGSIPSLAANTSLSQFYCHANQLTGWDGGTVSPTIGDFRAETNQLPVATINALLAAFVAANRTTGTRVLSLGGVGNAAPTGQGLTDKATLVSRGWTVTTN